MVNVHSPVHGDVTVQISVVIVRFEQDVGGASMYFTKREPNILRQHVTLHKRTHGLGSYMVR